MGCRLFSYLPSFLCSFSFSSLRYPTDNVSACPDDPFIMDGAASVGLGLGLGVIGHIGNEPQERGRRSPPPSATNGDESVNMSRSSSYSSFDLSDMSMLSAGSPSNGSAQRFHLSLLSSSPSGSTYQSPWMPSGGFSPATPSFSQFPTSHPQVAARATKIRQKKRRRFLNKLAIYLPKPLKPIASSPARLLGTLVVGSVVLLFCISALLSKDATSSTGRPAYLPNPAKVHDLYRRATGREPPAFIASLVAPGSAEESSLNSELGAASPNLHARNQQQHHLAPEQSRPQNDKVEEVGTGVDDSPDSEAKDAVYAQLAADLQADHVAEKATSEVSPPKKARIEVVDKCEGKGCNTCGNRGCDPEGYLRGKDVLKTNVPKALFRGKCCFCNA